MVVPTQQRVIWAEVNISLKMVSSECSHKEQGKDDAIRK